MNNRKPDIGSSSRLVNELARQWAPRIVFLGLILIIVSTLYPFKFIFTGDAPISTIIRSFRNRTTLMDAVANIVLFTPFGFGLASLLAKRQYRLLTKLVAILLICAALSFTIETLQVFLPTRKATLSDIFFNTLGGGAGYFCFRFGKDFIYNFAARAMQIIRQFFARFSLKQLLVALFGYTVLASLLVFHWQSSGLTRWDPNLSLAIGSGSVIERFARRPIQSLPWEGTVSEVVISDRGLARSEVETLFTDPNSFVQGNPSILAAYALKGPEDTRDQTGQSPPLSWQGQTPSDASPVGAAISATQWLKTSEPVKLLNQRIQDRSEFTLSATIATVNPKAPPRTIQRILSISNQMDFGNLTLAQSQSGINIWLRTGNTKEMRHYVKYIPDVLLDTRPHQIVITYSAFILRVYIDSTEQFSILDLTPNRYQIILYMLILVPLAVLIGLIANKLKRSSPAYLILLGSGTILPSLILESFLANEGDRKIRLANLLLGMLIVGGTILALKGNSLRRLKPHDLGNFRF